MRAGRGTLRDNARGRVKRYAMVAMATRNLIRPWNRTSCEVKARAGFLRDRADLLSRFSELRFFV